MGRPVAEGSSPPAGFDRVRRPEPGRVRDRDRAGKEALYSTAPSARPTAPVEMRCERCGAQMGLATGDALRLLRPPWLFNPLSRRLWSRCPACSRRAWLVVTPGPSLRALLSRPPTD